MKKISLAFLMFFITPNLFAQQTKVDSLVAKLRVAKNDEQRLMVFKQLSAANYPEKDIPALIAYCKQNIAIAKKADKAKSEEFYLMVMSWAYVQSYNYPKGLEVAFEGMQLSEKIKDVAFTTRFLNSVFTIMSGKSNSNDERHRAINYGLKGLYFAKQTGDKQLIGMLSYNIATEYRKMGKAMLDSANYYMQQAYQMAAAIKDAASGYAISGLGLIQDSLQHTNQALSYYRLSVPPFQKSHNDRMVCAVYTQMADLYRRTNQPDSALHYATLGYELTKDRNMQKSVNLAASLLSKLYKGNNELESLRYYQIASIARESADNDEKIKQFQIVTANEQQREQDIAEQQLKDKEEREQTLQLIAIGLFIPCFLVTVFLLNRTRVHRGFIDFMGVLSLLLLFEFITLLIHPRVVELTHHTPVLELLILVGSAAILVPLHHRSTHWLKGKLSAGKPATVKEKEEE